MQLVQSRARRLPRTHTDGLARQYPRQIDARERARLKAGGPDCAEENEKSGKDPRAPNDDGRSQHIAEILNQENITTIRVPTD